MVLISADEQPKRPLSAYNYFFKSERARLLGLEEPSLDMVHDHEKSGKRRHRKVHGAIGFRDLASQVGSKWKALSDEEKAPYVRLFQQDRTRYRTEMKAWNDRQKRHKKSQDQVLLSNPEKVKNPDQVRSTTPSNLQGFGSVTSYPSPCSVASILENQSKSLQLFSDNSGFKDLSLSLSTFEAAPISGNIHSKSIYDITNDFRSSKKDVDAALEKALGIINQEELYSFDNFLDPCRKPHEELANNMALDQGLRGFMKQEPSIMVDESDFDQFLANFDFDDDEAPLHKKPKYEPRPHAFSNKLQESAKMLARLNSQLNAMKAALVSMKSAPHLAPIEENTSKPERPNSRSFEMKSLESLSSKPPSIDVLNASFQSLDGALDELWNSPLASSNSEEHERLSKRLTHEEEELLWSELSIKPVGICNDGARAA